MSAQHDDGCGKDRRWRAAESKEVNAITAATTATCGSITNGVIIGPRFLLLPPTAMTQPGEKCVDNTKNNSTHHLSPDIFI
jgi:uncharacterized protein involved in propanediol utilization